MSIGNILIILAIIVAGIGWMMIPKDNFKSPNDEKTSQ